MGNLNHLLGHSRLPNHLRTTTTRQEVARLAFEAMKRNGEEREERYKRGKEQERKEYVNFIRNGKGDIKVKDLSELKDILKIVGNENDYVLKWFAIKLKLEDGHHPSIEHFTSRSFMNNRYLTTLSKRMGIDKNEGKMIRLGPKS